MKDWNAQDHLKTPEQCAEFLEATLQDIVSDNDHEFLVQAVKQVVDALKRMKQGGD